MNWKQKLTSRKWWNSLIGFITPLVLGFGFSEELWVKVIGMVMAGVSLAAFIVGEAICDASDNHRGRDDE